MSFTYDSGATINGQVRLLIGDTVESTANFSDEEIAAMLLVNSQSLFMACAMALDALAARTSEQFNDITIGSLTLTDQNKVAALQAQAERFRQLEYDTPAFAIVEENLSQMNELIIIRNFILKNELL